jgi:hypothetical protein
MGIPRDTLRKALERTAREGDPRSDAQPRTGAA